MNENPGGGLKIGMRGRSSKPTLEEIEAQAKTLMNRILACCQALKEPERQLELLQEEYETDGSESQDKDDREIVRKLRILHHNAGQRARAVEEEITRLKWKLESVRADISDAHSKAEIAAKRLENQHLHGPNAELELIRAAEIQAAEARRLLSLMLEIDEVLRKVHEAERAHIEKMAEALGPRMLGAKRQPDRQPDIRGTIAGLDAARGIPAPAPHTPPIPPAATGYRKAPALGGLPPPKLEESLKKVPGVPAGAVQVHADPFTGALHKNDPHNGRRQLDYDPHDPIAAPTAAGARNSEPIIAQAGFDGTYDATGPGSTKVVLHPVIPGVKE